MTDFIQERHGQSALLFLENLFREQDLPLPPLPEKYISELRTISGKAVGTKDLPPKAQLYDISRFIDESIATSDGLYAGFDGYGVGSWAVHYYLIEGPLRLFIQRHWSSPYLDAAETAAHITLSFQYAAKLRSKMQEAQSGGKVPAGQILIVEDSDFTQPRWGWFINGTTDWKADRRPLASALEAVVKLTS